MAVTGVIGTVIVGVVWMVLASGGASETNAGSAGGLDPAAPSALSGPGLPGIGEPDPGTEGEAAVLGADVTSTSSVDASNSSTTVSAPTATSPAPSTTSTMVSSTTVSMPSSASTASTGSSTTATTPSTDPSTTTTANGQSTTTSSSTTSTTTATPAPPSTDGDEAIQQAVLDATNAERAAAGCDPLKLDPVLTNAADGHSEDMAARSYFSHSDPEGRGPGARIDASGYPYRSWGENIAAGQSSAGAVVEDWMNSEGHRKNILNCTFNEIGIGYAEGAAIDRVPGRFWTQLFATRG